MNSKVTNILTVAFCAVACAASAETIVIAPGYGVETNVTEQINGSVSLQINDEFSQDEIEDSSTEEEERGGGIVRLLNDWNMYSGDTRVMCGTLEASVMRDSYKPSSLGRNAISAQTLYVGNGTFRYAGPSATSSRKLVVDTGRPRHAAVVDVASDLAFTGGFRSESGTLLKTGAGTLTLEQPDGIWQMTTRGDGFPWPPDPTVLNGNGDSPESIYETGSLTILEGRLAVKGGNAVTNYFGTLCPDAVTETSAGLTYIGKSSGDGMERSAHLDIYGGYNHFGEYIRFDGSNGFTRACNSSLNVYGGTVAARFVEVGDAKGMSVETCPELNVYEGGAAKIGYFQIARSKGSKGRVGVYGGRIDAVGAMYVANDSGGDSWSDPLLPTAHITVASNGWLVGNMAVGEYSRLTLRLASGGTYQFWSLSDNGRVVVEGDGGTFRQTSQEATFRNTTLRIGAGGLTLYGNTMIFPGVVENDPSAEEIGVLTVDCGTAKLLGSVDFTGEIAVKDNRSLVLSGDVSASKITMDAGTLSADSDATVRHLAHGVGKISTLAFNVLNGSVKKLNLEGWDVPASVNVTISGAVSGATYDLMTVPADCGVSASTFVVKSVNGSGSLTATFSVERSGDSAVVRATVGPASAQLADGGTRTWSSTAGGDWATDANWTEGTAPADGARTAVSFPMASSGEKTSVSLNKGVALSGLAFDSAPGYKVAGSGSMDVYKSGTAVVSSKSGTNAVDTAMTYSGTLRLAAQLGGRLELSSLEGRGNVQLNDGGSGAAAGLSGLGSVVIGNAQIYGTLRECNGLLEVGSLGPGVTELLIGYGLFRYTGGNYTLNGSLTAQANNYAQTQIEITDPEAVFTVNGLVTQVEGGFTKRGKGALVFNGDGDNYVSHSSLHKYAFSDAGYAEHDNAWGKNDLSTIDGSGQAQSFFGLSCAGGLLGWGKEGQSLTVRGGDFVIGTTTTASPGCEYDAAAEINGGETVVANGDIVISRNHGNSKKNTAEKEALTAKLTVNDGHVKANNLYLTFNDWGLSKSDSRFEQNGGSVEVVNAYIGYSDKGQSTASWTINGGCFKASNWFSIAPHCPGLGEVSVALNGGVLDVGYYVGMGEAYGDAKSDLRMTLDIGGELRCVNCVRAYNGSATVNLNENGAVYAQGIDVFGAYAGNDHTLNFDGGRFLCTKAGDFVLKDWKNLNIGEKGAWLDTSEMTGGMLYFRNAVKSATGAIHVCGDDPMRPVAFDNVAVAAPIMVEPGGSAYAYLTACQNASATVCNGGAFGSRWTSTAGAATQVASLTLGTNGNDRTMLYFTTGSGYITPVKVSGDLAVNGIVEIAVMNDGRTSYEPAAFSSKPILVAPKGTINADSFEFTTLMPMVQATFEVTSYDDSFDQLVMTTVVDQDGDSFSTHTWSAAAGGAWGAASNWDRAPNNQVNSKVVFTEILQGQQTVDLGGTKTLGSIVSAAQDLTLANGALSFATTSGAKVETTKGTLALPAISVDANGLTLATAAGSTQIVSQAISTPTPATPVVVNPTASSGTVCLAAPQNGQAFASASGTLEGPASAFDGGKVTVNDATLHVTEGGFVKSPISGTGEGMVLRTDEDTWFESDVSSSQTFIKAGPGTAYLSGAGAVQLGARNWDQANDAPVAVLPDNGDIPKTRDENTCFVNAGTLVFGLNPSQSVSIPNGHILIGSRFVEFDQNGDVIQPTLEIYGGTVKLPNIRMGADLGTYRLTAGNEGKIVRPTMNVYGGDVTFAGCYMGVNDGNVNSVNTLNLYGGTMTSSDQWIAFGYGRTTYEPQYGQAKSIINIHGGLLELTNPADNVGEISKMNGDVDINLFGGELAYAGRCHVTGNKKSTKINIRLAGGKLTAKKLTCADFDQWDTTGSGGCRALYWDGGTFKPTEDGNQLDSNWTANVVAAGGAKFDLSAIPDGIYTLNKPFTHDSECEGEDGGIELTAGGTLILNAANEMNGPVVVRGGVVVPTLQEAVPGGIVLAGGTFNCNNQEFQVPYLKGAGGESVNGMITVLGMLAPLDTAQVDAPYATVESLDIAQDAVVKCPIKETEDGWIAPYFRVKYSFTGKLVLDFGLDSDVSLPSDIRVKVAEYAGSVSSFPALTGINYGIARGRTFAKETVTDSETGMTSVYAVLRPMGTVVVFR